MHPAMAANRILSDLAGLDARTHARLDRIESMLESIMRVAGLEPPPALPLPTVEVSGPPALIGPSSPDLPS